jgi:hypothetical protein
LHYADARLSEQGIHAVRVRAEAAQVAEAEDGVHVSPPGVGQRGRQRGGVAVDPTEDRDPPVLGQKFLHDIPVWWQVTQAAW